MDARTWKPDHPARQGQDVVLDDLAVGGKLRSLVDGEVVQEREILELVPSGPQRKCVTLGDGERSELRVEQDGEEVVLTVCSETSVSPGTARSFFE